MNITIFETYTDVVHGNSKNIYLLGQGMGTKNHTVNYLLSNHGKLSEFLDNKKLSVNIVKYPNNLGSYGKKILKQNPIKLIISLLRYNYKIYKKLKYLKPDIIHCTSTRSIISCGFASRLYGAKLVWVIQMEHSNALLDLLATMLSNHIIFIARSLMDNKSKFLKGMMESKSQVIPIGIDLDESSQKVIYNNINQTGLNVLCVASLVPDKGIHLLVDAMKDLVGKKYNIKCTFVGQEVPEHEEYITKIKREISESNLSSRIIFHGWTSDVQSVLLQSDIFVLPSKSEGLSRAILEAMFVGIPVIAFDTGALFEIIDDNVGKLMKKDTNQSISKALEFYLNDANLIRIHGQEARKRVEDEYTLGQYLENMDQFYNRV
jgi:glycosyltransferase involved in cell wall biosynthesis